MIINRAHDFGFIHIPKCAGSSIRHQLRDKDDLGGRFYQTMTLPDLGRINSNHVPLRILESHLPEVLEQLRAVTSYAIMREPHDRFRSAVAQHMRAHIAEPGDLSVPEITEATDQIIEGILADPHGRNIRNTIFFAQVDYIYLNGAKEIDHVFPMDRMTDLFDQLETQHGLTLERDQVWNPTVTYRWSRSSDALKRLKTKAQQLLPTRAYAMVRDLGIRIFTTKGAPKLEEILTSSEAVRNFVEDHYAKDIITYKALCAGQMPQSSP